VTVDAFNMLSLPIPQMSQSAKTTSEGYILRYQTSERNLNFKHNTPPDIMGDAIRDYVATSANIEP